jgi:antitoxin YobK
MAIADYERAVALIDQHEHEADFAGPRPPELIERAEQAVGVRFPPTYRRFLLEYGAGNVGSTEIYGVVDHDFENSSAPDAIWHNLTSRREGLFTFYAVGEGTEFCLDTTRTTPDGEMPVVAVTTSGATKEEVAPDFGSAFLMLVQEELGYDDDE